MNINNQTALDHISAMSNNSGNSNAEKIAAGIFGGFGGGLAFVALAAIITTASVVIAKKVYANKEKKEVEQDGPSSNLIDAKSNNMFCFPAFHTPEAPLGLLVR